jgi:DNA-binding transcriptional LysR family regulator
MRFRDLDLNLLIALDALIEEQSVSGAAERLHLSQSAVSGSLARLRAALGDELLLQRGRRMIPTQRATELAAAVKDILQAIDRRILTPETFDPATSTRAFSIMASDFALAVGLAPALRAMHRIAPNIRLEVLPLGLDPVGQLERGEVSLLVMPDIYVPRDTPQRPAFADHYVCVAWTGNTELGSDTIPLEALTTLPQVVVEFHRQRSATPFRWVHEQLGHPLRRELTVSSYGVVPFLIPGTQRISLMHSRLAAVYAKVLPLRILQLPIDIPGIFEVIQWQRSNETDDALMWVVDVIATNAGAPDDDRQVDGTRPQASRVETS